MAVCVFALGVMFYLFCASKRVLSSHTNGYNKCVLLWIQWNCELWVYVIEKNSKFHFPFRCARAWILVFTSGVCTTGMHKDLTDSIAVTRDIRTVESEWVVKVARLSCIYWKRIFYQCALCGRIFRIWECVRVCDLHTQMPLLSAAVFAFCILLALWVVLIQVTSYKNVKYMRTECRINVQIVGGRWDCCRLYIQWNKSHCRWRTCDYCADESNWSQFLWFRWFFFHQFLSSTFRFDFKQKQVAY